MKIRRFVTLLLAAFAAFAVVGPASAAPVMPVDKAPVGVPSPDVDAIIASAKINDPGFSKRRDLMATSGAFVQVLKETTPDYQKSLDYFTAISSDQVAADLVETTSGKHYVISGSEADPKVELVEGEVMDDSSAISDSAKVAAPRCGKAWAAFSAWLVGTTMLCAPFSGPAAWACAVSMGLLGLMPDFNDACD